VKGMDEGVYYCPLCGGLLIAVKALFMRGILRVKCFSCGYDAYVKEVYVKTWRKRDERRG